MPACSLTLRDYSKVVAAHKLLLSRKHTSKKTDFPKMPGGSMPSLRARWTAVCLAVLFLGFLPTFLAAQGASGRILGRVADPSGAVLSGAKVALLNEATGINRSGTT